MDPTNHDSLLRYRRRRRPFWRRRRQVRPMRKKAPFDVEETQRVRAGWLLVFFIGAFAILGGRAFHLTVLQHDFLVKQAEAGRLTAMPLTKPRGEILDRNGERLAGAIDVDSVFAHPHKVKHPEQAAEALSKILCMDRDKILAGLTRSERKFVWIKRKISAEQSDAIDQLDDEMLKGVHRVKESTRTYPRGNLAAQVLGFTNVDMVGLEGLEREYEDQLAGQSGEIIALRDAKGNVYLSEGVHIEGRTQGVNLKLTLDATIQWFAEQALDEIVKKHHPKGCWVIVTDVRSGKILAIANRPTYDPAAANISKPGDRRIRAVLDMYEPGSTMKPLTMAMALEDGKVDLNEKIHCGLGKYYYGGHTIHDEHNIGLASPATIIKESSNIGISKIAQRLGAKGLYNWLRRFGMGQRTGVDLPGESKGILRNYKDWYPIDIATHSYGQGISVTALQLLMATNALGNGGRLMLPYLVSEIIDADGKVLKRNNPQIVRRVVSEKVADDVLEMMRLVTTSGGTGTRAALGNFPVAGKTGTAYKVDPRTGKYHPTKRVGSFIGMVPGDAPVLGIIVVVDEPRGVGFGGVVAAPAFREIATRSLDYLGVFAVQKQEEQALAAKIAANMNRDEKQPRVDAARVASRNCKDGFVPDFLGLTMRKAQALAGRHSVTLELEGTGIAVRQSPSPGRSMSQARKVKLVFAAKH
ncbi:MAG: penicillin-binding protein [Candidatus Lernaella stagnicola]|nr:penicillin-binding protein [Candidatus Lernaella stagnicola]